MVRLIVKKFGKVDNVLTGKVIEIVDECYHRLQPHSVSLVELYIYEKWFTMTALISDEEKQLGITTSPLSELFFATHDAWYGIPRIRVGLDKLAEQSELIVSGVIRHEVAHTVLHGSLEYFIFPTPRSLQTIGKELNIPENTLRDAVYLIAIAAKDYEVTRLLHRKGYLDDLVECNKYFLKPAEEDAGIWSIAHQNPSAKLLAIASYFKEICCAAPLLQDEKYGDEMTVAVKQCLIHLPTEISDGILRTVLKGLASFTEETHKNVELLAECLINCLR